MTSVSKPTGMPSAVANGPTTSVPDQPGFGVAVMNPYRGSERRSSTGPNEPIPIAAVRQNSEDMAIMLEWFDRVGYSADIASLEGKWGIKPLTLREWVRSQKK